jgi:hypothetical protein
MYTVVGDRYLELMGIGDLTLMAEIAQTMRSLQATAAEPTTELAAFERQLISFIMSEDLAQTQILMDETFSFVLWGSEGYEVSSDEATEQLQQNYLFSGQTIDFEVEVPDLSNVLGPQSIVSVWDPAKNPVDALFSTGWGSDGQDEAFLIIIQKPDGSYAWDGIILASGSYGGFVGLYAPTD